MPEVHEGAVRRAKKSFADLATRLRGESGLSGSIENQREPLERIVEQCAGESQVKEAERMLKVIGYYEEALENPQRRTRELEKVLKERVLFLWDIVPKYTEFDLSNPRNPSFEVLRPKKHEGEKKVTRREGGFVALNLEEIEDKDTKWFELVKRIRTEDSRVPRAFRLFNCYAQLKPTEDKPFRSASIQLKRGTPGKTASEEIASASLTTYGAGKQNLTSTK